LSFIVFSCLSKSVKIGEQRDQLFRDANFPTHFFLGLNTDKILLNKTEMSLEQQDDNSD
jgi:hypothetical protein